jgi:hypothetical protein
VKMTESDGDYLRFELKNSKPVDLLDLTGALSAFGDAYKDYVISAGLEHVPDNVRLFVREVRSGSIIADLISLAHQASFVVDHKEAIAQFASHLNDILQFLLLPGAMSESASPTKKEAAQAISIMEPVAKDSASQLNVTVAGDMHVHQHYHYNSQEANAIQNNAHRFLGRPLPTSQLYQDQILSLYQMRGDPSAKVGDKGIIEEISPLPAKIVFSSEEVKKQIIEQPENPFKKLFLVDVQAKAAEGKVRLYQIFAVKDVLDKD